MKQMRSPLITGIVGVLTIIIVTCWFMGPPDIYRDREDYVEPRPAPFKWREIKSNISLDRSTAPQVNRTDECHILLPLGRDSCSTLPNFFLHKNRREDFKDAIINFWHIQKTGGSSFRECIHTMYEQLSYPSPMISMPSCVSPISRFLDDDTLVKNMSYKPIIEGHYSLGVCDFMHEVIADRKCSAFTIFREPYERAVSNYFFVRQKSKEKQTVRDSFELPINEWLKKRGSIVWNSFLYPNLKVTTDGNGVKKCSKARDMESVQPIKTPWPQKESIMDDLVNNLDTKLSFVGLFEDRRTTYKMLQEIYHLPFYDLCADIQKKTGLYEGLNATLQHKLKAEAKEILLKDEELRELMKFDVRIYERAKQIFYAQKAEFEKMQN